MNKREYSEEIERRAQSIIDEIVPVLVEISARTIQLGISQDDSRQILLATLDEVKEGVFDYINKNFAPGGPGEGGVIEEASSIGESLRSTFGIVKNPYVTIGDNDGAIDFIVDDDNTVGISMSLSFARLVEHNKEYLLRIMNKYPELTPSSFLHGSKGCSDMTWDVLKTMKCGLFEAYSLCVFLLSSRQ